MEFVPGDPAVASENGSDGMSLDNEGNEYGEYQGKKCIKNWYF